ncbi:hypothetical protein L665_04385 [Ralstonia solanacearum SD54]|nr:hypothetical protein F504_3188 [Ralstonia pseudosolanacearum FQY_4]ANH31472.1 hypothetical protein A3768_0288 [Ralstonia solanacearum]ARU21290.1 transposase [Ralstonia solanacearum]ESS49441.1 hypothetical protein L665_04385 [Ralstonia solanacearum SD54]
MGALIHAENSPVPGCGARWRTCIFSCCLFASAPSIFTGLDPICRTNALHGPSPRRP